MTTLQASRVGALLALTLLVACATLWFTRPVVASSHARIVATVRCAFPAEDSLAHLRLVSLTHEGDTWHVRYRCVRGGY